MTLRTIKRYELIAEIGRGGMAVVYKARDTALDRQVALKLLHPHLASRADSSRRFAREAKAVARLRHPNIVEIYDFSGDPEDDDKFIVTEFIDGLTLRDFVEEVGVAFPEVGVAITLKVADALAHAHEIGIIHRDIKPENVMLRDDGRVKLMDFGIAHVLDADRMTASGSLLGSPAHMPPEIIDGNPGDFRADIFSLGTVLYFSTVNQLPFLGNTPTAVLRNIIESRYVPPTLANPGIGRGLEQIIERCLASDPDGRYDDIEQLREALRGQLEAVEIEDAAVMARDYIVDPEGFTERFRPILVERLLELAREAINQRHIQQAGDLLNRVLAYDPDNDEAILLLRRLRSGRRVRVFALAAVVCLALLAVAWGTMEALRTLEKPGAEPVAVTGNEVDQKPDLPAPGVTGEHMGGVASENLEKLYTGAAAVAVEQVQEQLMTRTLARRVAPRNASAALFSAAAGARYRPANQVAVVRNNGQRPNRKNGNNGSDNGENPSATDPTATDDGQLVPPQAVTLQTASYEVSPPDTWAEVDGKRFPAQDGVVFVKLPPGTYEVTFDCPKKCQPTTRKLFLPPPVNPEKGDTWTKTDVIMSWAPGHISVRQSPGSNSFYLVLWPGESEPRHIVTNKRLPVSGFNPNIPHPLELVVYQMAAGTQLSDQKQKTVENQAAKWKEVEVGPGDNVLVNF